MNNEFRELNNMELDQIAGGVGIGLDGDPATPDENPFVGIGNDGSPFVGILNDGSPFFPIVFGSPVVPIAKPGKP